MPRKKNLSKLSAEPDPYSFKKYPAAFGIELAGGRQMQNARQIARHSKKAGLGFGVYHNQFRQRLEPGKTRELQRTLGYVERDGRMMRRRDAAKLRKLAARELLQRQGKAFVGPLVPYAPPRPGVSLPAFPWDPHSHALPPTIARWPGDPVVRRLEF
jgi:hypothetical protein